MSVLEPIAHPAHRASTLAERIARLDLQAPPDAADLENGRVRLERWRAQVPFQDAGLFARRLGQAGIDEERLLRVLAARDDARELGPPSWWTRIESVYGEAPAHPAVKRLLEGDPARVWVLIAFGPLLSASVERAERLVREPSGSSGPGGDERPTLAALFLPLLAQRLLQLAERTVTLELNVRRERGALRGTTARERFEDFVAALRTRGGALALLAEYPVLARSALGMAEQWVCFCADVALHLREDRALLARELPEAFGTGSPVALRGDLSDPHHAGRSVLIVRFEGGGEIVYKPRSLAVEARFQDLLRFLGERGLDPPQRRLVVIDRGSHGWMEMAVAGSCSTLEEVRRFYRRQGAQLAILHGLGGTDFHHENLVAAGEHPLLVDLECLFSRFPTGANQHYVVEALARSLLVLGLLPRPLAGADDAGAWDLSGLGARGGGARWLERLRDEGSDLARLDRKLGTRRSPDSVPRLQGTEVELTEHVDALAAGFSDTHRLLQRCRAELLAEDGPVDAFGPAPVRFLARATEGYDRLLHALAHPHYQGDGLARERLIDRLWAATAEWRYYLPLVEHEQRDVRQGDIPYFETRPDSVDLLASDGTAIEGFFASDGLTVVRRRLLELDEKDRTTQLRILRSAIQVAAGTVDEPPLASAEGPPPTRERLVSAASELGSRLADLAVQLDGGGRVFFAPRHAGGGRWRYDVITTSLYDGQLGVAVFLAHLARLTGDERFTGLARATADPVARLLLSSPGVLRDIGGMTGWGGVIVAALHLARLWRDERWLDLATAAAHQIERQLAQDREPDLVSGAAGALLALLRLSRRKDAAKNLELAARCADQLLGHAVAAGGGLGWKSSRLDAPPLAGLSHGAAGIAWALGEAATATGERRFAEAAAAAHRYEQSLFDPEQKNWRDLRRADDGAEALRHAIQEPSPCAWCHGAAGIALGRCLTLPHLGEGDRAAARVQMEVAATTLLARPVRTTGSLCHGELGNLLILQQLQGALPGLDLATRIGARSGVLLAEAEVHGWRPDAVAGVEQPGLMTGLAGIGYGLLRLAVPEVVPDILALEVPDFGDPTPGETA